MYSSLLWCYCRVLIVNQFLFSIMGTREQERGLLSILGGDLIHPTRSVTGRPKPQCQTCKTTLPRIVEFIQTIVTNLKSGTLIPLCSLISFLQKIQNIILYSMNMANKRERHVLRLIWSIAEWNSPTMPPHNRHSPDKRTIAGETPLPSISIALL